VTYRDLDDQWPIDEFPIDEYPALTTTAEKEDKRPRHRKYDTRTPWMYVIIVAAWVLLS
jgi:hypothetical protein